MRRSCLVLSLALLAGEGCGDSPTGPGARPCATVEGIEICADRAEYRPGADVGLTITNRGEETVYKDYCSTEIVGKTAREAVFEVDYDPTLLCGEDVTPAEIVDRMVELSPGASIQESHRLARFAFQGFYRVNVWILDEMGTPLTTTPLYSGTFEVFPTAR